jgi:hypothetical protein
LAGSSLVSRKPRGFIPVLDPLTQAPSPQKRANNVLALVQFLLYNLCAVLIFVIAFKTDHA